MADRSNSRPRGGTRNGARRRNPVLPTEPIGIGNALRFAREDKPMSIEQAANATRIRLDHLIAFEEEDFARLPAAVFARGLLRTYASFLGLDGNELVGLLDAHQLLETNLAVRSETPRLASGGSNAPKLLLTLAIILIFAALAYYLYSQYSAFVNYERVFVASTPAAIAPSPPSASPTIASPPATGVPLASAPTPSAPPTPGTAPATPTQSPASPTPGPQPSPSPTALKAVNIEARFSGRVWLQVVVDDQQIFQGTLNAGDRRVWTGKKVFLWAGNAGAVEIVYNGKPQGRLGAVGEVVKTTWTAN